uniref:NADH-ubiquinone oxidoreductase chain 3 n=1 Tax=Haematopinus quadripertusus TaxID=1453187 RepID=A0AAU7YS62_9NEOP
MLNLLMWFMLVIFVIVLLLVISVLVSHAMEPELDQNEPFECGFSNVSDMHMPFCIHFFVISLLFLVFDMELVVSLPLILMSVNMVSWLVVWLLYSFILFVGIIMEIMWGSLDWDK